jgi:type I protein arginine methyltransferase
LYQKYVQPWAQPSFDFDLSIARTSVLNSWEKGRFSPEQLLSAPSAWATLDYATMESPDVGGSVSATITRRGTVHGLAVWFDAVLAEGIAFSNAPGGPDLIYGSAFFPFLNPVAVDPGDEVTTVFDARYVGKECIWRWNSVVRAQNPLVVKARFDQSTFESTPLALEWIKKVAPPYIPELNDEGLITRVALEWMGQHCSIGELADRLLHQFPSRFTRPQEALTFAGRLSLRYGI